MTTKFIIKNIHMVASWGYNVRATDCTICRCNLNLPSLTYQDNGIDSNISIGVCGHTFHTDCIQSWINMNNTNCPLGCNNWTISEVINVKEK
jgi:hypothetical protein